MLALEFSFLFFSGGLFMLNWLLVRGILMALALFLRSFLGNNYRLLLSLVLLSLLFDAEVSYFSYKVLRLLYC
jgi:hypothetical protein